MGGGLELRVGDGEERELTFWVQKPIWRNMGPLTFARKPQEYTPSYPITISKRKKYIY